MSSGIAIILIVLGALAEILSLIFFGGTNGIIKNWDEMKDDFAQEHPEIPEEVFMQAVFKARGIALAVLVVSLIFILVGTGSLSGLLSF